MFFRQSFSPPQANDGSTRRRNSLSSDSTSSTTTRRPTPVPTARFHYLGDQPLEITSSLKGYNFTRTCSSSLYAMESSKKENLREFFTWRVLRWILIPTLLLALILSLSLYFLLSSNGEELVVISDNLIDTSLNTQDLETHSTFYYRPKDRNDPNGTSSQDFDSGELLDLDVSDPPNFLDEGQKNPSNINNSGEMTFVDRLISTFSQAGSLGQRLTNLGESGLKQQPGTKLVERNRTKEGTTQGLAVSPTLPSVRPRGHQPTRDPPLNHTESVCRSPSISLCRGIVPWDLTSLPSLPATLPSLDSPSALREALPYFEMVLQSGCSPRAKHFLCPLLEPQCQPYGKQLTPPCRNTCRAVAEDCSDFILGTLDLSKVFQCDLYPEPSATTTCVDLTKGTTCLKDEMRCTDGSCIPQRWKCDGNPDCPGGGDETTCVKCPAQQFTCGSKDKCIPIAFRCDGHTDCPDSSDEMDCHQPEYDRVMHSHASPCPSGELRCVDGRCISLSQICDGNRDCSDAADESNCRQPSAT